MNNHLSKSDYKVARECPTKLYYKKLGYPSTKESNDYLKMLAEGGYMVGKMAQLMYPEGIEISSDNALEETLEYLKQDTITLFEPLISVNNKIIRVDILEKKGNTFNLIEVKAKSFDGSAGKEQFWSRRTNEIKTDWKSYLEDVTFQAIVLREAFPNAQINAFLFMPDKSKTAQIDGLAKWFKIKKTENDNKFKKYTVLFEGDSEALLKEKFLTLLDVSNEVNRLEEEVKKASDYFVQSLIDEPTKIVVPINKNCKNCEYLVSENQSLNGFRECWGNLADTKPHLLELYNGGALGRGELIDTLIQEGKVSLFDVPEEEFTGIRGERQKIQVEYTRNNCEWINPDFKETLLSIEYPLHFIDFETYQSAIPYHKGMKPYDKVAFQWSCHTLEEPDSEPIHKEFLNLEDYFPNFQFAEELMKAVGNKGSILIWSSYENTVLRDIHSQINSYGHNSNKYKKLRKWIEKTAKIHKEDTSRLIDMNHLCLHNYFHPEMKGKTSIKQVLPAIWNNAPELHQIPWLEDCYLERDGEVLSPYAALAQIEIAGKAEAVREGTGAMRAYEEMLYGLSKDDSTKKEQWAKLLRQYCKLDTLAMLIIWKYWVSKFQET
jgi:hypothetical protein